MGYRAGHVRAGEGRQVARKVPSLSPPPRDCSGLRNDRILELMTNLYLAFYKGPGAHPVTWAIRKITRSIYSHVALVFSDGGVAECTGKPVRKPVGVRWRKRIPDRERSSWDFVPVRATRFEESLIRSFVDAHLGEPFSFRGLFSFVCPWLKLEEIDGWICTTFVVHALHYAGVMPDVPATLCPGDLMEAAQWSQAHIDHSLPVAA